MKQRIELLAPGGDVDAIKSAIAAGANAVYCGLERFNARNRASNISFDELLGVLHLAHKNNCKVFLTLNTLILENEISDLITLLNKLVNTNIDGIIVQDLGVFYLLSKYFKSIEIHASTQCTTHNKGQIEFLSQLNVSRVNLCRELNLSEIKILSEYGVSHNVSTEVFVHGSNCVSFSGLCYMSSVISGNSGNRGRCSQPCRDKYKKTEKNKNFPLNLKDNSAYTDLIELADAGVYSLKIEGRIKRYDYVYSVVKTWVDQIELFYKTQKISSDKSALYKVFNRDFTNGYLSGIINQNMFIDNPRDNSIQHLNDIKSYSSEITFENDCLKLYNEKDEIKNSVETIINKLNINKIPLTILISGKFGEKLNVLIITDNNTFE